MGAKIWCNMDLAKAFRLHLKSDNCVVGKTGSSNGLAGFQFDKKSYVTKSCSKGEVVTGATRWHKSPLPTVVYDV